MDKELLHSIVRSESGYSFERPDLLLQAFTRRSYTEEHGGENNEVLEFIGDKVLDVAVVQLLVSRYGKLKNGESVEGYAGGAVLVNLMERKGVYTDNGRQEYTCEHTEGELTRIKSRLVDKNYLSRRIDSLSFADYLRMGNSDIRNNVSKSPSVKEDLFEAIIGAIAIDCKWDMGKIIPAVDALLDMSSFFRTEGEDDYEMLISNWAMETDGTRPLFRFDKDFIGVNGDRMCIMKLSDLSEFYGRGRTNSEARYNVCKNAYYELRRKGLYHEMTMRDEIPEPTKEDAIGQLEILARRGYFDLPTYSYDEAHDENGNPVWTVVCSIDGYRRKKAVSSSKKDAKKASAFKMLKYVLKEDENNG